MSSVEALERQEHLQKLQPFCRALDKVFVQTVVPPAQSLEVWRVAVSAQCVQCGIEVFGEELFALSKPPSAELASAKIGRMRLGDCARKGCTSCYYRLTFRPYAELNWPQVLGQAEAIKNGIEGETRDEHANRSRGRSMFWHLPATRRIVGASMLIMILLILRQWYIGGRIPLLREPERFQAAPDSLAPAVTNE